MYTTTKSVRSVSTAAVLRVITHTHTCVCSRGEKVSRAHTLEKSTGVVVETIRDDTSRTPLRVGRSYASLLCFVGTAYTCNLSPLLVDRSSRCVVFRGFLFTRCAHEYGRRGYTFVLVCTCFFLPISWICLRGERLILRRTSLAIEF